MTLCVFADWNLCSFQRRWIVIKPKPKPQFTQMRLRSINSASVFINFPLISILISPHRCRFDVWVCDTNGSREIHRTQAVWALSHGTEHECVLFHKLWAKDEWKKSRHCFRTFIWKRISKDLSPFVQNFTLKWRITVLRRSRQHFQHARDELAFLARALCGI